MFTATTQKMLIIATIFIGSANAHGFLAKPISRNAVGKSGNGHCTWSGSTPCFGDFMSLGGTTGPDSTGCTNSGGRGDVTGSTPGTLGFGNTKVITQYSKGQTIDDDIDVTAYHGGKFVFKIQDVGANNDPNGALWENLTPLAVESYSPDCGSACPVKEPCAPAHQGGTGAAVGTCAQIPLTKGDHNGKYNIKLQLPSDMACEHCVLQWHWTSSNSCDGGLACSGSEQFWNCADLKITGDGSSSTPATPLTPATPVPSPSPEATPEPSAEPSPSPAPSNTGSSCHSLQAHVQDSWCQLNCPDMVDAYPAFCAMDSSRRLRGTRK